MIYFFYLHFGTTQKQKFLDYVNRSISVLYLSVCGMQVHLAGGIMFYEQRRIQFVEYQPNFMYIR